jgi:hypothetical protein
MLSFEYTAIGPESKSRLQFDRFNFSDESLVAVGEERTDHVEHGVTEATDDQNVSGRTKLFWYSFDSGKDKLAVRERNREVGY